MRMASQWKPSAPPFSSAPGDYWMTNCSVLSVALIGHSGARWPANELLPAEERGGARKPTEGGAHVGQGEAEIAFVHVNSPRNIKVFPIFDRIRVFTCPRAGLARIATRSEQANRGQNSMKSSGHSILQTFLTYQSRRTITVQKLITLNGSLANSVVRIRKAEPGCRRKVHWLRASHSVLSNQGD